MRILLVALLALAFMGCQEPITHVIEEFEPGTPKLEYTFSGTDTLNRQETEYHPNGQIFKQGPVKNGLREGEWKAWYQDGTLWSIQNFKAGLKEGENRVWYENGILRFEGGFKEDRRFGNWVFYDMEGDTVDTRSFTLEE